MDHYSTPWKDRVSLPQDAKKTGAYEYHFACPVTGAGKDGAWISLNPDRQLIGCRKCSPNNGRLRGRAFKEHMQALGLWIDKPKVESWIWTNPVDRRTRTQLRFPGSSDKPWKNQQDPPDVMSLLFFPCLYDGLDENDSLDLRLNHKRIILVEGATSGQALFRLGFNAVGHKAQRLSDDEDRNQIVRATLACIKCEQIQIWPDHDAAGYSQAFQLMLALRDVGRTNITWIDPTKLTDNPMLKYDPRNWAEEQE